MIDELVPQAVATVEAFDDSTPCVLFPAEEAVIARAVDKRRREFTTVRWCARQALGKVGYSAVPLLPGVRGAPVWPDGIVGSMTHCLGYRAAAVARASVVTTIGIDAEPNEPLPEGLLNSIALEGERSAVTALLSLAPDVRWDRLLFCAKEAVYKAWFPLTHRWLGFDEAEVSVDSQSGDFRARLRVEAPFLPNGTRLGEFSGRWLVRRGLIVTAIAVPDGGCAALRQS